MLALIYSPRARTLKTSQEPEKTMPVVMQGVLGNFDG